VRGHKDSIASFNGPEHFGRFALQLSNIGELHKSSSSYTCDHGLERDHEEVKIQDDANGKGEGVRHLLLGLALPTNPEVRYPYLIGEVTMLAKKTAKNQVTLPKKALQEIPETDYFDVTTKGGMLILRPVTVTEPGSRLATVRRKIKDLGIEPKDLDRAIAWARGRRDRRR